VSDTAASLRRKTAGAEDLQSVVRTMKALAASSITQYEQSVSALAHYSRTVSLGLGACLREHGPATSLEADGYAGAEHATGALVFGSDQGLVGRFNDVVADHAIAALASLPGETSVWAVGERVQARLTDAGLRLAGGFPVPNSVQAIAPLVGQVQLAMETYLKQSTSAAIYVFHNHPRSDGTYEPASQRLLPLDTSWQQRLAEVPWPSSTRPEILGGGTDALRALVREHLFISLFQACAESLASENASRLAAMERADRNIDELLRDLESTSHRLRQASIDAELFEVVAAYESLTK